MVRMKAENRGWSSCLAARLSSCVAAVAAALVVGTCLCFALPTTARADSGIQGVTVNLYDYSSSGWENINYRGYNKRRFQFTNGDVQRINGEIDKLNTWSGNWTGHNNGDNFRLPGIVNSYLDEGDPSNLTLTRNYRGESLGYLFNEGTSGVDAYEDVNAENFLKLEDGYRVYDSSQNGANYNERTNSISQTGFVGSGAQFMPFGSGNFHFGMTVEANFMYPTDGQVNSGGTKKDMIFEFSGDDDVWVFVDGRLALDLGGIHSVQAGTINFATGTVYYQNSGETEKLVNLGIGSYDADGSYRLGSDWSTHTLTFIYLERGQGDSNCKIKFNMPTIPEGTVQIGKVVDYSNIPNSISDVSFQFKAYIDYDGDDSGYELFTGTYDVYDANDNPVASGKQTGDNGIIELKDGQYATLNGNGQIKATSRFKVTEVGATSDKYTVTIDNTEVKYNDYVGGAQSESYLVGERARLEFHNSISAENQFNLHVQKSGSGLPVDGTYRIKVMVGSLPYTGSYDVYNADSTFVKSEQSAPDGIIELGPGQYAVISGLQGGNVVTAQEVDENGDAFTGDNLYNSPTYEVNGSNEGTVVASSNEGLASATAAEGDALGSEPVITLTVTNSTKSGSLSITKNVAGGAGNSSQHFSFKLTSEALSGLTFDVETAGASEGDTQHSDQITFDSDGVATLSLKHGETATIQGLRVGAEIFVQETGLENASAYTTVSARLAEEEDQIVWGGNSEISGPESSSDFSASIALNTTAEVTFTNTSELAPTTSSSVGNTAPMIGLLAVAGVGAAAVIAKHHSGKRGEDAWKE